MNEIKSTELKIVEVEQKAVKVIAYCPECKEEGILVATGRGGALIQGSQPKAEHLCSNCKKQHFIDGQFPRIDYRNSDGSEDEVQKAMMKFLAPQENKSNLIITP